MYVRQIQARNNTCSQTNADGSDALLMGMPGISL